jgi:hypothetical protein
MSVRQPSLPGSESIRLWMAEARAKYTRPKNTTPERDKQILQGAWQEVIDGKLSNIYAIQIKVCEQMVADMRAAVEMGKTVAEAEEAAARSGALMMVQELSGDLVGEGFDEDPERVAAERVAILTRRAIEARQAGRTHDADWLELAADRVRSGGLVPDDGIERVGLERLKAFAERLARG